MSGRGPSRQMSGWNLMSVSGYRRNRAKRGPRASVANDPNVWSGRAYQEDFDELAVSGLASMYQTSDWSLALGRHGYQRAGELITGKASTDHLGHQCSLAPGRPSLHLVSSSRRPRRTTKFVGCSCGLKLACFKGAAASQNAPRDAR
jgi:hypothetical protein